MRDRGIVLLSAAAGAALGAMAGFLFFTERGRQVRREIEPTLTGLLEQAAQFGDTLSHVRETAADSLEAVRGMVSEATSSLRSADNGGPGARAH